eukprot:11148760-Alexandrium_andersonii.AAC.1
MCRPFRARSAPTLQRLHIGVSRPSRDWFASWRPPRPCKWIPKHLGIHVAVSLSPHVADRPFGQQ